MMSFLSNRQRLLPALLILAGLGLVALAFGIDAVGIGDEGFGKQQKLLLALGLIGLFAGIALSAPFSQRLVKWLTTTERDEGPFGNQVLNVALVVVCFSILSGLVEGIGLLILTVLVRPMEVWVEILWISPVVNLILFSLAATLLIISGWALPRIPLVLFSVALMTLLLVFNWISVASTPWPLEGYAFLILATGLTVAFTRWFRKEPSRNIRLIRRSTPVMAALLILLIGVMEVGSSIQERITISNLEDAPPDAPNILVIVIDTLRADHLGTYGYDRPTSPNIDRIASEGVVFNNAFSTSPYTAPSHASLLTGTYPNEHQTMYTLEDRFYLDGRRLPRFDDRFTTMPEYLSEMGYKTGAFSANPWFFTRPMGFDRGFIHFEDFFHSPGAMFTSTVYGKKVNENILRRLGIRWNPGRKVAADVNDSVIGWIEKNQDVPFFVFINYMDAHEPYLPPKPFRGKFQDPENLGAKLNPAYLAVAKEENTVGGYDSSIAYVDDNIGQLLSGIKGLGLDENFLVVITSDHGEAFGEHGTLRHRNSLHIEEIQVPLIFWKPDKLPRDLRVETPVTNASLPSTIVEMIDETSQNSFPNKSLKQLWETDDSRQIEWPHPLAEMEHWPWNTEEYAGAEAPSRHGFSRSVFSANWHYIEHETLGSKLYKWREDPNEKNDLSQSLEGQFIIDRLQASLQTVLATR